MRVRYKELSLQQINTFREICRRGSYAEAGRQMRMSTSAVWEQVRGLERYFDLPLLEKRHGAIVPTRDGLRLLEAAGPHLARLESTRELLHQLRGRPPQSITLVSGMRMLNEEIAPAVAQFRKRYDDVRLRLLYVADTEIDALIENGQADLGLLLERTDAAFHESRNVHELAYELEFLLVAPRTHPLISRKSLRLADIAGHPLIVGTSGTATRSWIDHVFYRYKLSNKVRIAIETNSAAITFAHVRAGSGIGITAAPLRGVLTRGLGVRSLSRWFGNARYSFVWSQGADTLPVHRELAELIREFAT
jgi:DNA-binding transcriptional LysR family regulator